jgi:hypothetical protein
MGFNPCGKCHEVPKGRLRATQDTRCAEFQPSLRDWIRFQNGTQDYILGLNSGVPSGLGGIFPQPL